MVIVAGKGAVAFDRFILGGEQAANPYAMLKTPDLLLLLMLRRLLLSIPLMMVAVGAILDAAFGARRSAAVASLALIPGPENRVRSKPLLVCAEILIAVIATVWLTRVGFSGLAHRHSRWSDLGIIPTNFPDSAIVGALAFWRTLASFSWRFHWRAAWRWVAMAVFVGFASFGIFAGAYTGLDWPTDIVASLFLGAAISCAALWFADRFVPQIPAPTADND